ncbi:MAG: trypsin-like serine protease [Labilithrix sp.]|nr:trypsin-like serine protease [Labilithrix sp.]
MRLAVASLLLVSSLSACSLQLEPTPEPYPAPASPGPAPAPPNTPTLASPQPAPAPTDDGVLAEVVYVSMRDTLNQRWFCTGTLVSKSTVVTAAHCLDTSRFVSYEIVAPLAAGAPKVSASQPKVFGGPFDDVANPDVGILTLDKPIVLPRYAELTDVVARIDAGEALTVAAVIRTAERPDAPLHVSPQMPLSSTVEYGYEHGFGTPMFSKGGDSGAGLFLVENGKPTHKLVGVARQPEPARDLDHFTRVDAPFMAWFAENTSRRP